VEVIEYPPGTGRDAISFLSAYDAEGKAGYDASGYIKWKNISSSILQMTRKSFLTDTISSGTEMSVWENL